MTERVQINWPCCAIVAFIGAFVGIEIGYVVGVAVFIVQHIH